MKTLRKNTEAIIVDVQSYDVVSQHSSIELAEKNWKGYPQEVICVEWLDNSISLEDAVYNYVKDRYYE